MLPVLCPGRPVTTREATGQCFCRKTNAAKTSQGPHIALCCNWRISIQLIQPEWVLDA